MGFTTFLFVLEDYLYIRTLSYVTTPKKKVGNDYCETLFLALPATARGLMKLLLRALVASPKKLHHDADLGLVLDLAYVTPQLILCSGPVSSYYKSFYRYPLSDLVRFLDHYHGKEGAGWHIWNFRGEGPGYEDTEVAGRVSHFPFPDHQPPSLDILIQAVAEMKAFLDESPKHVAVLHCKAGKGRAGTMCCAYMMADSEILTLKEAIDILTQKRMREFAGDSVSIKSQKRYLEYWHRYLRGSLLEKRRFDAYNSGAALLGRERSHITSITFKGIPATSDKDAFGLLFAIQAYQKAPGSAHGTQIVELYRQRNVELQLTNGSCTAKITKNIYLDCTTGDVKIAINDVEYTWLNIFYETLAFCNGKLPTNHSRKLISASFSSSWDDFDGFKGTGLLGKKLFDSLEILWQVSC